jgi:hypothetical protein
VPRKPTAQEAKVIEKIEATRAAKEKEVSVPPQMQEFISAACEALRERGEAIDVRSISREVKTLNPRGKAANNYVLMAGIEAWEAEQHQFGQVDQRVLDLFGEESERMARRLYGRIHEIAASEWETERRAHDEEHRRYQTLKGVLKELEDERDALKVENERLKPFEAALADAQRQAELAEERHKTAVANARAEGFREAMAALKGDAAAPAEAETEKPKRAPRKAKSQKPVEAVEDETPDEVPDGDALQALLDGKSEGEA